MWAIRYALVCALLYPVLVCSQGLPRAWSPERVGFSSERLGRLSEAMKTGVDAGEIPGSVVLVARRGRIAYFESFGFRDRATKAPMERDAIHRIASMTKPFTSLAAMMLVEEGKIALTDPVSRHISEFKDLKVGVEKKDASGKAELVLEAAQREMNIQDLLRHTSGLTYGIFGRSMVKDQYNAAKLTDAEQTNREMVAKLSKLPLQSQPGTVWDYSMSTDVLGRVVEVVSGMELGVFFRERIFKPLGLQDTAYWVEDPAKHARIAEPLPDAVTGKRPAGVVDVTLKRAWQSGGTGLVSTAADYARFCQFLLNGGELDGVRLVSRKTIEYMTSDHILPGTRVVNFPVAVIDTKAEHGQSFGLGFAVRVSAGRSPVPGSVGDYGWVGASGTQFWVDPKEEMFAILMVQNAPLPTRLKYWTLMRNLVYQALIN